MQDQKKNEGISYKLFYASVFDYFLQLNIPPSLHELNKNEYNIIEMLIIK